MLFGRLNASIRVMAESRWTLGVVVFGMALNGYADRFDGNFHEHLFRNVGEVRAPPVASDRADPDDTIAGVMTGGSCVGYVR